ncbi:hypothetical protein SAMN05660976_01304 [Nonomuraea pusilla]|uniref:Uncharacterized protein n=1 Tax=Nonomuraea pusilla TaxID=46177 RepID=A0A1H7KME1_9ACTN|nr:hypothetical protein SAMN05660976_01304 [Nonomuraea pusilla]
MASTMAVRPAHPPTPPHLPNPRHRHPSLGTTHGTDHATHGADCVTDGADHATDGADCAAHRAECGKHSGDARDQSDHSDHRGAGGNGDLAGNSVAPGPAHGPGSPRNTAGCGFGLARYPLGDGPVFGSVFAGSSVGRSSALV